MRILDELETLPVSSMLKLDGTEHTVHSVWTLHELYQPGGSSEWQRQGRTSRGLVLSRQTLLLRMPKSDGGAYGWFRVMPSGTASLRAFYRGGDSPGEWGPASRFAKQGQSGEVSYTLEGTTWLLRDLGALEVAVEGENAFGTSGDRFYTVTSQSVDGSRWLFYLDARPGEARGTGGAFAGEEINPTLQVEDVL